ncbi:MAG TPA: RNA 2',3'-cyclic phosphodiesterase [Thermoanaerobaculia bacterium]|nr:RNA 2',3'-cyclic phosphodiesterase [Thermoanaerobaculia bacterium]
MRLFVALELSDEARAVMRRRLGKLRSALPRSRWVDPDQAHLTLLFLGNTEPQLLPRLDAELAAAFASHAPFAIRLHGGGTFPHGRPAHVAWVGVKAPPELAALQRSVVLACQAATGVDPEGRPYHAHVTLTRPNPPWRRQVVERFLQEVQGSWGEELVVRQGVLLESRLSPRGAQYLPQARFPLSEVGA